MLKSLMRNELLNLKPYSTPPIPAGYLALHLNESPYPRFADLEELDLSQYPMNREMATSALAQFYGVHQDEILITPGSDEGIASLIRLCCQAYRDSILINTPTFPMYAFYAKVQGVAIHECRLRESENFSLDLKAIQNTVSPQVKIIFICSPNNPTGTLAATEDIIQLAESCPGSLIVIDEAYVEFSRSGSLIPLMRDYENIVILRTLSKAHGLAGIRCGSVIARAELIHYLKAISSPFPLSSQTLAMTAYALSPKAWKKTQSEIKSIQSERERLLSACQQFSRFTKVYPSEANFIYLRCKDAPSFAARCYENKIIIKSDANTVRISISTPENNERWIALC